jgi:hypothetical protein
MGVELVLVPEGDDSLGVSLLAAPLVGWQPREPMPDEPGVPWSAEALRQLQQGSVITDPGSIRKG